MWWSAPCWLEESSRASCSERNLLIRRRFLLSQNDSSRIFYTPHLSMFLAGVWSLTCVYIYPGTCDKNINLYSLHSTEVVSWTCNSWRWLALPCHSGWQKHGKKANSHIRGGKHILMADQKCTLIYTQFHTAFILIHSDMRETRYAPLIHEALGDLFWVLSPLFRVDMLQNKVTLSMKK